MLPFIESLDFFFNFSDFFIIFKLSSTTFIKISTQEKNQSHKYRDQKLTWRWRNLCFWVFQCFFCWYFYECCSR